MLDFCGENSIGVDLCREMGGKKSKEGIIFAYMQIRKMYVISSNSVVGRLPNFIADEW